MLPSRAAIPLCCVHVCKRVTDQLTMAFFFSFTIFSFLLKSIGNARNMSLSLRKSIFFCFMLWNHRWHKDASMSLSLHLQQTHQRRQCWVLQPIVIFIRVESARYTHLMTDWNGEMKYFPELSFAEALLHMLNAPNISSFHISFSCQFCKNAD